MLLQRYSLFQFLDCYWQIISSFISGNRTFKASKALNVRKDKGSAQLAQTRNRYRLPIPKDALIAVDRTSSPAHLGKLRNAVDLLVPPSTPVLAAADGVVTFVKNDSRNGGPNLSYWLDSNFIVLQHSYGEYSRYDHLEYKSAKVHIGQRVRAGQHIAQTGMSGFTFIPHLHFHFFVILATTYGQILILWQ
jgi:murein DD-endopeptidase MepM/ murein hydrolase activator NlpD